MKNRGRLNLFKTDREHSGETLNLETIVDKSVIRGPVNSVVDQTLAFREKFVPPKLY